MLTAEAAASIKDQIYTKVSPFQACYRLLTVNGTLGCATPTDGLTGALRYVDSENALTALCTNPPSYNVSVVLTQATFTKETVDLLSSKLRNTLAGLALVNNADNKRPTMPWSPASTFPQRTLDLHGDSGFKWNPNGSVRI